LNSLEEEVYGVDRMSDVTLMSFRIVCIHYGLMGSIPCQGVEN